MVSPPVCQHLEGDQEPAGRDGRLPPRADVGRGDADCKYYQLCNRRYAWRIIFVLVVVVVQGGGRGGRGGGRPLSWVPPRRAVRRALTPAAALVITISGQRWLIVMRAATARCLNERTGPKAKQRQTARQTAPNGALSVAHRRGRQPSEARLRRGFGAHRVHRMHRLLRARGSTRGLHKTRCPPGGPPRPPAWLQGARNPKHVITLKPTPAAQPRWLCRPAAAAQQRTFPQTRGR